MIKLVGLEATGDAELELRFSDGSHGAWSTAGVNSDSIHLPVEQVPPLYPILVNA